MKLRYEITYTKIYDDSILRWNIWNTYYLAPGIRVRMCIRNCGFGIHRFRVPSPPKFFGVLHTTNSYNLLQRWCGYLIVHSTKSWFKWILQCGSDDQLLWNTSTRREKRQKLEHVSSCMWRCWCEWVVLAVLPGKLQDSHSRIRPLAQSVSNSL